MIKVFFRFGGRIDVIGELDEKAVEKLVDKAPFRSRVNRWGDEIYFELPVRLGLKGERVEMEVGEIAYWPPGNALCLFFGPTPVSKGDEPRAYSPAKPLGRVLEGLEKLREVRDGEEVEVKFMAENDF